MQLRFFIIIILYLTIINCSNHKNENQQKLWHDIFSYFEKVHFASTNSEKPLPCLEAVIHLDTDFFEPTIHTKEIESFLSSSIEELEREDLLSKEDFKLVDVPISFKNFNELERKELYFGSEKKCGLLLSTLYKIKNRAVLYYGIMRSPKAGANYLIFLEYVPSKQKWEVVNNKLLSIS